jgi:NAD(P)H-hydrate epimerase
MARLTGAGVKDVLAQRLEIARQFAGNHQSWVVLKSHRTLLAHPDGTLWVNTTGNPGMATGGTGDVLTGMIAAMMAQHPRNLPMAIAAAVYLHGMAGDLARDSLGEHSLIATDLLRFLPEAFRTAREHAQNRRAILYP